jgi:membrane protease YdiL (CAAX protease family)
MTQVALFLFILFGVTWPWGYVARPLFVSGHLWTFLAGLLPSVWAPTIIALIVIRWAEGAAGVREELRARLSYRPESVRWLVLAGSVPILVTAVAIVSARATGDATSFISSTAILPTIGLQVITGAAGEELGWRGFLLPRLGRQLGAMAAAVVMGILWALWHVPAFFTPGMPHQFMPMASFLLLVALFGVFLALMFNHAGESVLPTMLAHLSLNVTLAIGGVNLTSVVFWRTMAAIYGAIAVVAMIRSWIRPVHIADQPTPA